MHGKKCEKNDDDDGNQFVSIIYLNVFVFVSISLIRSIVFHQPLSVLLTTTNNNDDDDSVTHNIWPISDDATNVYVFDGLNIEKKRV